MLRHGWCSRLLPGVAALITSVICTSGVFAAELVPTHDSDTYQGYGSTTSLPVSYWDHALLKFDLSAITGPIQSARLQIHYDSSSEVQLKVWSHASDSWDESSNVPRREASDLIDEPTASGIGYVEVDVTDYTQQELTSDQLASFEIGTGLSSWRRIASRESSNPPRLVIETGDQPASVLTSISVLPNSGSVYVGDSITFQATGQDQFGSAMSVSPVWAVSDGGSISSSGVFTAGFAGGPYTVTASASGLAGTATVTVTERPVENVPPVAAFSPSTIVGTAPLDVQFTSTSTDADGTIASWSWNFGDGNTSVEPSPSHVFNTAGQYTVALTVTDNDGGTNTTDQIITVSLPDSGGSGEMATLNPIQDTSTYGNYGTRDTLPVSYWDHTVFKFDLTGISGTPTSATFRLYYRGQEGLSLELFSHPSDNWDETNKPTRVFDATTSLTSVPTPSEGYVEFDVTDYLASVAGTSPISFKVTGSTGSWNTVYPRESSTPPQLVIETGVAEPSVLTSLSVSPISQDLFTGDSADFTATALDQYGNPMNVAVTWEVSAGGSITQSGSFTAGNTAGAFTITASSGDKTATATANVAERPPENVPPVAAFSPSTTVGTAPLDVQFTSTSTDADGTIASWSWNFGDGNTSVEPSPSHVFNTAGQYTVALTVTDNDGGTNTTDQIITVSLPDSGGSGEMATLNPIQDTSTYGNYGTRDTLPVSYWDHTVFKFDLTGISGTPTSATFRLYYRGQEGLSLELFSHPSDNWDETNKPTRVFDATTSLTSVPTPSEGYVEFDVTDYLASVAGTSPISFKVAGSTGSWNTVYPRESSTPPQLVIETGVAEPSVLSSLSVSPISQDLFTEDSADFTATALDQYGNPMNVAVTWEVSAGGSITQDGRFTAGNTAGSFTITASSGDKSATATANVAERPAENVPPVAAFSPSTTVGTAPLDVQFTSTSTDADGTIASWSWNFGDGQTSNVASPSHAFTSEGTYTVTLTVTDDDGASTQTSTDIVVGPAPIQTPPLAAIQSSTDNGFIPLPVQFTGVYSDADGTVTSVHWDFGDGNESIEPSPGHVYTAAGSYTVTLTVTDNDGLTGTATKTIVATNLAPENVPPTAAIDTNLDSGEAPLTVQFTSTSTDSDGSIASQTWDFADGGSSDEVAPQHTFETAGTYTVTLTVTDDGGDTDEATRDITVTAPSGGSGETVTLTSILDNASISYRNYGSTALVPASFWDHAFFQFDISELTGVPHSATLRLYFQGSAGLTLDLFPHTSGNWGESSAPPEENNQNEIIASATSVDGEYVEFDVTEHLASVINDGNEVSFELMTSSGSWSHIHTREGEFQPQLVVETSPPEPPHLMTLVISPDGESIEEGQSLSFSAAGYDQHGSPFADVTDLQWEVSAGGTIAANGLFSATDAGGPYTVTASSGGVTASATVTVTEPPYAPPAVVIAEIHYAPLEGDDYEFIELANTTDSAVSLDGYQLSGDIQFTFPPEASLAAGERLLVAKQADQYASSPLVYEWTSGSLDDAEGTVTLLDDQDAIVSSVSWASDGNWSGVGSGSGSSLELIETNLDASLAESWTSSETPGGSPAGVYEPSSLLKEVAVHSGNRFLAYDDGSPYFWLADTQWDIVHKATRELADEVLDDRQAKGFTGIQIPMMFHWSTSDPNRYGELPGEPGNWNEAYWEHVDYIVDGMIERGMHPIILPAWGNLSGGENNFFTQEEAYDYGVWLAQRYLDRDGVIYVVGGDRTEPQDCCGVVDAIARGIKSVDPARPMSFHSYYQSRNEGHTNAEWLDFTAWQTGHHTCDDRTEFTLVNQYLQNEWNTSPNRPVVNMEPRYEDIPCNNGARFGADEVRVSSYWSVFAGSFGISYGQHPLWYFNNWENNDGTDDSAAVRASLAAEFSSQLQHLKNLMLSRPFFSRVPDNALVGGANGIGATRGDGYIMVYSGFGDSFTVNTASLSGKQVNAWWFNPRDGSTEALPSFTGGGSHSFDPSGSGTSNDRVLVLDDASLGFAAPGQTE